MIRTFFELLLSRSHDDSSPKTGWLRRLLLRDVRLLRFDLETQQLDTLLRSTAAKQQQEMASDEDIAELTLPPRNQTPKTARAKKQKNSLAWLGGFAAAAILLIALLPNWLRPNAPAVHAGELSHQLTIVPGEVLRLLTQIAKTSQTELPRLSPLANLTLPTLPAWEDLALRVESPVREEINYWQDGWQKIKTRWPSQSQDL